MLVDRWGFSAAVATKLCKVCTGRCFLFPLSFLSVWFPQCLGLHQHRRLRRGLCSLMPRLSEREQSEKKGIKSISKDKLLAWSLLSLLDETNRKKERAASAAAVTIEEKKSKYIRANFEINPRYAEISSDTQHAHSPGRVPSGTRSEE